MSEETALTRDAFLGGLLTLHQPRKGQRAGSDAALLAAAVPAEAGERVLELGAGVGPALLAVARRAPGCIGFGLEIDAFLVDIANRNARENALADRVRVLAGDVAAPPVELSPGSFDHVLANPPFFDPVRSRTSPHPARARARSADAEMLQTWLQTAARMLKPQGRLTLIYRAERLDELLAGLTGRFGNVQILPLWPGAGRPAKRLILTARKGAASGVALCQGVTLHRPDGGYTEAVERILREGAPLEF